MRLRATLSLLAIALVGCSGVSKLDWALGRDGWQRPADVIAALGLQSGDRVADLGAGDGYFVPWLEDAVGPTGRVYAVEVDEEKVQALEERFSGNGANVEVMLAGTEDPGLPDASIDLVLLVNTYHHIEDRPAYFQRLRGDLARGGRVAVLEPNEELTGFLSLFLDEGHTSAVEALAEEMGRAGYRREKSFDFLPIQVFEVFTPEGDAG